MGCPKACVLLAFVTLLGWVALGGCDSTTVEIRAEGSRTQPELFVEIGKHAAGQISVSNCSEQDWWGARHSTTRIEVPPGSRIIVLPSTQPLGGVGWCQAPVPTSAPCSQLRTQPEE